MYDEVEHQMASMAGELVLVLTRPTERVSS